MSWLASLGGVLYPRILVHNAYNMHSSVFTDAAEGNGKLLRRADCPRMRSNHSLIPREVQDSSDWTWGSLSAYFDRKTPSRLLSPNPTSFAIEPQSRSSTMTTRLERALVSRGQRSSRGGSAGGEDRRKAMFIRGESR
jgi:hypothetical protein